MTGIKVMALVAASAIATLWGGPVVASARQASGTTIVVTTTLDDLTNNGNCTLREALKAADTNTKVDKCGAGSPTGADTISIPAGTFQLTLGDLTAASSIQLSGAGAAATIIKGKGQGNTASRDLHVLANGVVTLSKLTLSNSYTAVRNDGTVTLSGVTVSNNGFDESQVSGDYVAAGLDNRGTATVTNTVFSADGGASAYQGAPTIMNASGKHVTVTATKLLNGTNNPTAIDNFGTLSLSSATLDGAAYNPIQGLGVGLYNESGSNATFGGVTFKNIGGGAGSLAIENDATVTGDQLVITDNQGALRNDGTMHITNTTISNNTYGDLVDNGGNLQMATTTFTGNSVGYAAMIENSPNATAILVNVTMTGNTGQTEPDGQASAGAIDNAGTITARNITVTGNDYAGTVVPSAGGIFNSHGAHFTIANSIVAGNTDSASASRDCGGTFQSLGYNLVQVVTGCTMSGTTTGDVTGQSPKLGPLANNGGPTQTEMPQSGSPAIDEGNPAAVGTSPALCPVLDQRGVARPRDGNGDGIKRCDIGAVEK
jgi:CSLREA domain-containing protein